MAVTKNCTTTLDSNYSVPDLHHTAKIDPDQPAGKLTPSVRRASAMSWPSTERQDDRGDRRSGLPFFTELSAGKQRE